MQSLLRTDHKTTVMGILNITPDSFSDGGRYFANVNGAVAHARQMLTEGADIIDIGGESTRPGAEAISAAEEIYRVLPVIRAIKLQLGQNVPISIDTYKSSVAEAALAAGAQMMNSLGGNQFDKNIYAVAKKYATPILIYHIKGEPRTMQQGEITYTDVIGEIKAFFANQLVFAEAVGIPKQDVWLDPGIGFGKTVPQNLEIIARLSEFKMFDVPIAIGVSRKSHLGMVLKEQLLLKELPLPTDRLEAALAETSIAVFKGATIVRTHDVLNTKKCLAVVDEMKR